jgi:hypothetical protein
MPLVNGKFTELVIPEKHGKLLYDKSHDWLVRVLYGGRDGAKDWSATACIIEQAIRRKIRVLFTREYQISIKASWHQLISDQIERLGYKDYFDIYKTEIASHIGSQFIFHGLNDLSSVNIKSTEGIDYAIIGEAENLTEKSYHDLEFTIRKDNAEIWIIFNPQYEDDFAYDYFITNTPDYCIASLVNGFALDKDGETVILSDNPFVGKRELQKAQHLFYSDRRAFDNQCLGLPIGGGGRVYPQYRRDVHFIDFDYSMLPECDLYMSIDPHYKYYPAIGWHAVTPTGVMVTYNEWPKFEDLGMWYDIAREKVTFDLSIEELANTILSEDLTLQYGGEIISRTGDPRFFKSEPSFRAELQKCGVTNWIDAPFERIETQRNNIKSAMNYNTKIPLIGHNRPTWYVSNRCKNINRAYLHHQWDEKKDKETETNKDFIDQDRYFMAIHNGVPKFKDRSPEETIHNTPLPKPTKDNTRHLM